MGLRVKPHTAFKTTTRTGSQPAYDILELAWRGISGDQMKRRLQRYKGRRGVRRRGQAWSLADDDMNCWLKRPYFLCVRVYAFANYNRFWALVCDAAQDYIGGVCGSLRNGAIVLFKIPTIEPLEVFTSRSNRVWQFHSMFRECVEFFGGMLAEHRRWWFDEAECIVKIVAQMFRVLILVEFYEARMRLASTQNLWNILVILSQRKPSAVSLSRLVSSSWNLERI